MSDKLPACRGCRQWATHQALDKLEACRTFSEEYDMKYEPEKWKNAYQDDGFVIVQELLDPSTLSALLDRMDKITRDQQDLPPTSQRKDISRTRSRKE